MAKKSKRRQPVKDKRKGPAATPPGWLTALGPWVNAAVTAARIYLESQH